MFFLPAGCCLAVASSGAGGGVGAAIGGRAAPCVSAAQAARLRRRDPSGRREEGETIRQLIGRGERGEERGEEEEEEERRRASWTTPSAEPRGGCAPAAAEGGEGSFCHPWWEGVSSMNAVLFIYFANYH